MTVDSDSVQERLRAAGRIVYPTATRSRVTVTTLTTAILVATAVVTGCYHLVMPVNPPRLPDEVAPLQLEGRRTVRLINGYTERKTIWFRTEGIHHLGVDLREWTDRLLSQLQIELEPRGVSALIENEGEREADAALRVWITNVIPPDSQRRLDASNDGASGRGPTLEATVKSEDGAYEATFSSGATSHGFSDALYSLKESILVDGNLVQWLSSR